MADSLLLFRMGSRVLALPGDVTRQVRSLETLTPLPASQGTLLGMTALAGRALPVLDLRALLGMPHAELPPLILLVNIQDQNLALPIEEVIGFMDSDGQEPGKDLLSEETLIGGYAEGHRAQLLNPDVLLNTVGQRLSVVSA